MQEHLKHLKKDKQLFVFMKREERAMQRIATEEKVLLLFDSVKIFFCVVYTHTQAKQNIRSDFQMCHCSLEVWSM